MSAPDYQISEALAEVLEPAPGEETDFLDVYGAVRRYLAAAYTADVSIGSVKRVMRAAGVCTRTPVTNDVQWAVGVRVIVPDAQTQTELDTRIRRALTNN